MTFFRKLTAVTGTTLMVSPALVALSPAFAAQNCGTTSPAATLIAPGICEVAFETAGDYTFTPPAGITKLSALLVGAGAGSFDYSGAYGGGGGEVYFWDSVQDFGGGVNITVGAGGAGGSTPSDGGATEVDTTTAFSADGGKTAVTNGGESGNGNAGVVDAIFGAGGGAGGAATSTSAPGAGLKASAAAAGSSLFPVITGERSFGKGGVSFDQSSPITVAPGDGGSIEISDGNLYFDGEDGAVYLRYAAFDELADTGSGVIPAGLGVFAAAAGAAMVVASRKRKQS